MKSFFALAAVIGLLTIATSPSATAAEPLPVIDQIKDILVKHDGEKLVPHAITGKDADPPKYFILYFSASW